MAAIEKIRRHSGLLIAIIGIALLAFVLQDLFQSTGGGRIPTMAVVDGDKVLQTDFEEAKKSVQVKYGFGDNLTSDQNLQLYNLTLDQMIKDKIMNEEYERAGFAVTTDELYDMLTDTTPNQTVVRYLGDRQGHVDTENIKNYIDNLENLSAQNPAAYEYWVELESVMKKDRLENKYNNLLKASYFLPKPLAKKYFENKNIKVSADIIAYPYTNIPDSTVKVTNADKKAYYEENKFRYETNDRRDIEYVMFEFKPSKEDHDAVYKLVQDSLKPKFVATANPVGFVNDSYNSSKHYDSTWVKRSQASGMIQKEIFDNGNGVGYVYGPYEEDDAINLVRIIDKQERSDSLRASNILVPFKGAYMSNDTVTTKEQALAKAEELLAQLVAAPEAEKDTLFAELAKQYNTDATKDKGGDLGWFMDGSMVPQFNEYVINNEIGSMGVVESVYGYHIVRVTDKNEPETKVRLAYVKQNIECSDQTRQDITIQAHKFFTDNRTYSKFNKAIEEQGLTKHVKQGLQKSTYSIDDLKSPREIVRWAFNENTKKGDICDKIFELDNQQLVIVAMTNAIPEGYAPMETVADHFKTQVINKKKGEIAVNKMKACGSDVEKMKSELGAITGTVNDLTFESNQLTIGSNQPYNLEGEIIGRICGMKEGQEIGPIAGTNCAYIIKNVKFTMPEDTEDYSEIVRAKTSQYSNKPMNDGVYRALKKQVKIEDHRNEIF